MPKLDGVAELGDYVTADLVFLRPDGVALGLLHQHYWVRLELRKTRAQDRDREDKESIKWLKGLDAAKQALNSAGVSADALKTISYGKEKPQCTESNEDCWQKYRRDHFTLLH